MRIEVQRLADVLPVWETPAIICTLSAYHHPRVLKHAERFADGLTNCTSHVPRISLATAYGSHKTMTSSQHIYSIQPFWEIGRLIWTQLKWNTHITYCSLKASRIASSGMLRLVALVRTDVSEELSPSFIRVTRIGELGTMLAVSSNRRTLRRNKSS
jgi:hypothetical protein